MLREIFDSQDDIRKQTDTEANTLKTGSNDNYCLIENLDQLKKVLDETLSDKALASTQKVNNAIRRIWRNKHSRTLYSHNSTIDFDAKYE